MASPEHDFVSRTFLEVAREMSHSEIFTYVEAERSRYDFGCLLTQHRTLAIVGQTLKDHPDGIEKDLNWLLLGGGDSVPVYLYSDVARHVSRIGEIVNNARARIPDRVGLLRLYEYPPFDADDEHER